MTDNLLTPEEEREARKKAVENCGQGEFEDGLQWFTKVAQDAKTRKAVSEEIKRELEKGLRLFKDYDARFVVTDTISHWQDFWEKKLGKEG